MPVHGQTDGHMTHVRMILLYSQHLQSLIWDHLPSFSKSTWKLLFTLFTVKIMWSWNIQLISTVVCWMCGIVKSVFYSVWNTQNIRRHYNRMDGDEINKYGTFGIYMVCLWMKLIMFVRRWVLWWWWSASRPACQSQTRCQKTAHENETLSQRSSGHISEVCYSIFCIIIVSHSVEL